MQLQLFKKENEKKNPELQKKAITNSFLMEDIGNAQREIDTLLLHLDYQTDPDMIDSYTYQLKGAYMRYKFLLRKIQQTGQISTSTYKNKADKSASTP